MFKRRGFAEARLIRGLLAGDNAAAEEFVQRHSTMVKAIAYSIVGSAHDAEDITQETFLKAISGLQTLKRPEQLTAWLAGIARNTAREHLRTRAKLHPSGVPAPERTTEGDPAASEVHLILQSEVMALEEPAREVILLYYFGKKSTRDIAELSGASTAAIEKRLQRARAALGAKMAERLDGALRHVRPTKREIAGILLAVQALPAASARAATVAGGAAAGVSVSTTAAALVMLLIALFGAWKWLLAPMLIEPPAFTGSKEAYERGKAAWTPPVVTMPEGTEEVALERPQPEQEQEIVLAAAASPGEVLEEETGGSMAGVVVDTAGQQLAHWEVYCTAMLDQSRFGKRWTTTTDDAGTFQVEGLPAGNYFLYVMPEDAHLPTRAQTTVVTLAENEHKEGVRIVFDSGRTMSGIVTDAAGKPIPEAYVTATPNAATDFVLEQDYGQDLIRVATDENGEFLLMTMLDAPYNIEVGHSQYETEYINEVPPAAEYLPIVLEYAGVLISGRVVDAKTGMAVTEFTIGYAPGEHTGQHGLNARVGAEQISNPRGEFEIEAVHSHGAVTVIAEASNYAPHMKPLQPVKGGQKLSDVLIELESGRTLKGRVVDKEDQPIKGAEISFGPAPNMSDGGFERKRSLTVAESASDGSFTVVLAGTERLISARKFRYVPASVPVPPSGAQDPEVKIILSDTGGIIEGTLRIDGGPPPNFKRTWVSLYPLDYDGTAIMRHMQRAKVFEDGRFRGDMLPDGTYEIEASWRSIDNSTMQTLRWGFSPGAVVIEKDKTTQMDINYQSGTSVLRGRLSHPANSVVLNGVLPEGKITYGAGTGGGTEFVLSGIHGGDYTLSFWPIDRPRHFEEVHIPEGAEVEIDVQVP